MTVLILYLEVEFWNLTSLSYSKSEESNGLENSSARHRKT